jgi:MoaA/NifB/PqqE/SkfB family radical SAM enzyme
MAQIEKVTDKKRTMLYEKIPLDTPYSVTIEPTSHCNFHCEYCVHSMTKEDAEKTGHVFGFLPDGAIDIIVDQLKMFPQKIKTVRFCGTGEPTVHKKLPDMIRNISENRIANEINMVTNGFLLTPELSERIIDSGIDSIRISLQGLSSDDYWNHCRVKIDFKEFISNLKYLFSIKGKCVITVKIMDDYLTSETKNYFYATFEKISDFIAIERFEKVFDINYDQFKYDTNLSRYEIPNLSRQNVCPMMFYRLNILQDERISLCCSIGNKMIVSQSKLRERPLKEIWDGPERLKYLLQNLKSDRTGQLEKCAACTYRTSLTFPEDRLDEHSAEVYARLTHKDKN